MADNVTPFPAAGAEQDRRHATYTALPPVSRFLSQMMDCAQAVRRQDDFINAVDSIRLLARIPLPTVAPLGTRALQEVRGVLIDELVHELVPSTKPEVEELLCALARMLRDEGGAR